VLVRARLGAVVARARPAVDGEWLVPPAPVTPGLPQQPVQPPPVPSPVPSPVPTAGVVARVRAFFAESQRLVVDPGRRGVAALAVVAIVACAVAGWAAWRARPQVEPVDVVRVSAGAPSIGDASTPSPPAELVVAVAGEVRRPGLVRLRPGARVADAVRAAGGIVAGARVDGLNLARKVVDGELVTVGVSGGAGISGGSGGPGAAAGDGGLVDLNTATVAQLDSLPGVGPVLAQRIVDHRERHGPFRSVDALREVDGIGEGRFAELRDRVTV
jgi:competence protein ComEA